MVWNPNGNFKQTNDGRISPVGQTHRFYKFDLTAQDDISILIPYGCEYIGILDPESACSYEIFTSARAGITTNDARRNLAADEDAPMRPCKPGEYLNISVATGNIEEITIVMEGGQSLPDGSDNLTTSDEG